MSNECLAPDAARRCRPNKAIAESFPEVFSRWRPASVEVMRPEKSCSFSSSNASSEPSARELSPGISDWDTRSTRISKRPGIETVSPGIREGMPLLEMWLCDRTILMIDGFFGNAVGPTLGHALPAGLRVPQSWMYLPSGVRGSELRDGF